MQGSELSHSNMEVMLFCVQVNESWYLDGCKERCMCAGGGVIECHNTTCSPTEICELKDGEYGCQPLGKTDG